MGNIMISDQKIKSWVDMYLKHVEEISAAVHVSDEEGYKFKAVETFQKNFDLNAGDLPKMLDKAIVNNNLVAGSWYFPRKMLLIFATDYEKETRAALSLLLDESKPVKDRIDDTRKTFEQLMDDRNKKTGQTSHSFIGIRFLSLLLGYRYPNVHNALKPREWKVYCGYIDDAFGIPQHTLDGSQYEIFAPYVEAMRKYIQTIPMINDLRTRLTEGLDFHDDEYHWMTQDVIYVTSRLFSKEEGLESDTPSSRSKEPEESDEEAETPATIGNKFYYEDDLENFVLENLDVMDLGDGLKLYADNKGVQGQQYPVDGHYIDLLTVDKSGNFVVIELKRDKATADVVGQILGYMKWVEDHLAQGKPVRGIVICGRGNPNLLSAASYVGDKVDIRYYDLKISLSKPK